MREQRRIAAQAHATMDTTLPTRAMSSLVSATLTLPGQPLDAPTRAFMEPQFGHDFSGVRVHTDSRAAESARAVNASAYTVGQHVVFGAGQFAPGTVTGHRRIAHELAHVVQQRRAGGMSRPATFRLGQTGDRLEDEATTIAASVADPTAMSTPGRVAGHAPGDTIQRELSPSAIAGISLGAVGVAAGIGLLVDYLLHSGTEHWETNVDNASLIRDPGARDVSEAALLPRGTRVVITDEGVNRPFNARREWVEVRVTTGPHINARGWLRHTQLINRPETAEVSPAVAQQLFGELARATFVNDRGAASPIPFHYPPDGCYARAQLMADLLTEKGYASEKVFAVSTMPDPRRPGAMGDLRVPTDYASEGPGQQNDPAVTWWYHVAPIIKVRDPRAGVVDMVLDPSLADGPRTVDQWTHMMNAGVFTHLTLAQVRDQLRANPRGYPPNERIVFTADRSTYNPNDVARDHTPAQADAELGADRRTMSTYAVRAGAHEIAAMIRRALRQAAIDITPIADAIRSATSEVRRDFQSEFNLLLADLRGRLSPADLSTLNAALALP